MNIFEYLPLWSFIILMVATPGPANMLAMKSGEQQGFYQSMPFVIGLICGKLLLNLGMMFGLYLIIIDNPLIAKVFSWICAIYITWLALRSWNSHNHSEKVQLHSFTFLQGIIVHPLNPKAWTMSLIAFSEFGIHFSGTFATYFLIPFSFIIVELIFHNLWCILGVLLHNTFGSSVLLNRSLIVLTIAVVFWAILY